MGRAPTPGPATWRNAAAARSGLPLLERGEALLYGDTSVSGQVVDGLGPYRVLNAFPSYAATAPVPMIALQADVHAATHLAPIENNEPGDTDDRTFHGGDDFDEVAAIISLSLGVRCVSGGMTRLWGLQDDHAGSGVPMMGWHRIPNLAHAGHSTLLPRSRAGGDLNRAAPVLSTYFRLQEPKDAVAVVRAARMYQRALWIADGDPNQAWIWMVGAAEVAATRTPRSRKAPISAIEDRWPEMFRALEEADPATRAAVAKLVAPTMRRTDHFLDFFDRYPPAAPPIRPPEAFCVDWTKLRAHLEKVYEWRSRALHDGTPFPDPMCDPPQQIDRPEILAEKPLGLSASSKGARWHASDTPLLLWTFEHIVRNSLLLWIESLRVVAAPQSPHRKATSARGPAVR